MFRNLYAQTKTLLTLLLIALCSLLIACSFDYYEFEPTEEILPDLVMENVEYVRVKSAEPQARFQAERAERYEKQNLMKIENITFEQFGESVEEVNTAGQLGTATMETDSGNILMDNGVRIEIESEDIVIETAAIEWQDETRILSTGEQDEINIFMSNGTSFTGIGFTADARNRTWEFISSVEGEYIFEDDEEENEKEDKDELDEENEVNNENE